MSITVYLPVEQVKSRLANAGLPAGLVDGMKASRFGGERKSPLYDQDYVSEFIEKNRPANADRVSSSKKEDLNVIDFSEAEKVVVGPLLKTKQAADYLAIGERQLQYEVGKGNIRCVRFGKNCIRFTQEDLDEYVNRHRTVCPTAGGN
jgi:excisionase family DNA binding protein